MKVGILHVFILDLRRGFHSLGCLGAKHIPKRDCWHHFEEPSPCDVIIVDLLAEVHSEIVGRWAAMVVHLGVSARAITEVPTLGVPHCFGDGFFEGSGCIAVPTTSATSCLSGHGR